MAPEGEPLALLLDADPAVVLAMTGFVRFGLAWGALAAMYMLFSEVVSVGELISAAVCATAGAVAMELVRRNTRRRFAIRPLWLFKLARTQLPAAFAECGMLFLALFRPLAARRAGIGAMWRIPFDGTTGRTASEAAGRRALVTTALCFTPNSVVVGLEMEPGHLLLHQLVPSARPPGDGDPVWPV